MTVNDYHLIKVTSNPSKDPHPTPKGDKPPHWVDKAGSSFHNPWKSFRAHSFRDKLNLLPAIASFPAPPKDIASLMPIRNPTWGRSAAATLDGKNKEDDEETDRSNSSKIKTTWLGHACFLVEFPAPPGSTDGRGVRVLFDPVFSSRCSPSQHIGPKRFTPPPCKIEDIPEVDAVVISHNHYDHLDTHTIRTLFRRTSRTPHFFAPLGNASFFKSLGIPTSHTHDMDWWESKRLVVQHSDAKDDANQPPLTVDITCTPGQHFTGRSLFDSFKTLWAGWAVEEVRQGEINGGGGGGGGEATRPPTKVYFAGDTAYRTVLDGDNEDEVPVCPAFKDIGAVFGGFDVALIPIGAYLPRDYMSRIHCAPQDSVMIFKDVKAKKALGMHWGTWTLTSENALDPPKGLAKECVKAGIEDGAFTVCDIGQTLWF
ncbi:Metal-dependent hydrolase lscR [Psilocybe cubensis]|uniref:Metallo-beta-lactamase domain-containing protein n=2 Tax=Psilocybe cubensis TaxID=181762 RepID=A0A8H7XLP9_PSICU|nr:Metal-dependent hydrolase lscR [Psilocybe cubensis]KAH9475547.1 Metal-dependent hydrolase lscR [Psilocybe cubensis]